MNRRTRLWGSVGLYGLLFVISCILPGPQFLIHLVLWILMPNEDRYPSRTI